MRRKACSKCGKRKLFTRDFFTPAPTCRDGLSKVCRKCKAAYHRQWKLDNAPRLRPVRRAAYAAGEKHVEAAREKERWNRDPLWRRARHMRQSVRDRALERGLPLSSELATVEWFYEELKRTPRCPCCGTGKGRAVS